MNIRHIPAIALLLGLGLLQSVQAAEVTGLRADIYSSNSAELFWDRVPNTALTYEVLRDGTLLGSTMGTSYYDDARTPGEINDYSVTSIDSTGMRSNPLTIAVQPFGPSGLQPLHLRGDVYSSTVAELFWVRVPDRDLSYEVMRDDGVTGTTRGDSFFDASRTPGVTNTYTVTVIDEQGIRHLPATLTLAAFGVESIDSPPATGLRATVYSNTAAEIHWDRIPNRNLRYEILRDDGLSNVTNGTSYYDNKRRPGAANTYIITTIDEEGNRSSAVSIDVAAF